VEYSIRRLKPLLILLGLCGAIEVAPFQSCFESSFRLAAPEGAIGNAALAVCLKAYPDTNLEFFRNRRGRAPHETFYETARLSFVQRSMRSRACWRFSSELATLKRR
jgi:hypothetical protein